MKSKFLLIVFAKLLVVSTMAAERQPIVSVVMSLCLKHLQALAPEFHDNTLFVDSQRGVIIRTDVNG